MQGLRPERQYELRVRAVNVLGRGPVSGPSAPAWTLGRPSIAPGAPRAASVHVDAIGLAWDDTPIEVQLIACGCLVVFVCFIASQLSLGYSSALLLPYT